MSIFYNATFRKIKTRWLTNHMTLRHKDRYHQPYFKATKKKHTSQTGKHNKQSQRPHFVIFRAVNTAIQTRNGQRRGGETEQESRKAKQWL